MKIRVFLLLACMSGFAFAQGGLRYSIQVVKFENNTKVKQWDIGDAWRSVMQDQLTQSKKYIVVAGGDMQYQAMKSQNKANNGRYAKGKQPKKGFMTPAQLLVKGSINFLDDGTSATGGGVSKGGITGRFKKVTSEIRGTVQVVDATTGVIVASHDFETKLSRRDVKLGLNSDGYKGDLQKFNKTPAGKVMKKAAKELIDFIDMQLDAVPWYGTVVKLSGDNIIIDRGSREGVTQGLILRVGQAEEIRSDTGELLDTDFNETGRLRVTEVKQKLCYATLVSGQPPKKGEMVYQ